MRMKKIMFSDRYGLTERQKDDDAAHRTDRALQSN